MWYLALQLFVIYIDDHHHKIILVRRRETEHRCCFHFKQQKSNQDSYQTHKIWVRLWQPRSSKDLYRRFSPTSGGPGPPRSLIALLDCWIAKLILVSTIMSLQSCLLVLVGLLNWLISVCHWCGVYCESYMNEWLIKGPFGNHFAFSFLIFCSEILFGNYFQFSI